MSKDVSASPVDAVVMSAEERINQFWFMLRLSWDIEPREYFEENAERSGDWSPEGMAVHYMWKRDASVAKAIEGAAERAFNAVQTIDGQPYSTLQKAALVAAAIRELKRA